MSFTLDQKVGQFLFVGIPGKTIDPETQQLLKTVQPGGVILFARNLESPQQMAELTTDIRRFVKITPLIGIDQEGGRVDRLRTITEPMPSAQEIRATGDAKFAYDLGHITADMLRLLGVNINFAPVLDLAVVEDQDNALQDRWFGSHPLKVGRLAGAYMEGLQNHGILGCGKHFPGLGDSNVDSHHKLPVVQRSEAQLMAEDLRVYIDLFGSLNTKLQSVMVAHAAYPTFDGNAGIPASLSPNIVTDLLRKKLEFQGLAISDDLEMGAITTTRTFRDAVVQAMVAGEDMLLVCNTPARIIEAHEALVKAVSEGKLSKNRMETSINRIAKIKARATAAPIFDSIAFQRAVDRLIALKHTISVQLARENHS
ncbi:MAG: beta-N-acetylhexosaminidase [Blastocatellia bacterium]|nr:beta-N-acetylhexosaminidase [Blastocatellia bacterium]